MSTFDTRAEIVFNNTYKSGPQLSPMLPVESTNNKNVSHQQSHVPVPKQRMFTKRIRRNPNIKRNGDQSIAPLLETISALAVNSDLSGSEYEEYEEERVDQRMNGLHYDEDEDVEDYDFEQASAAEEQQIKSFGNCHGKCVYYNNNKWCSFLLFGQVI